MLRVDGDNHRRVLAALALVNADGEGVREFVEVAELVLDGSAIVLHRKDLIDHLDCRDTADVAVEDFALVVVSRLQNLVADAERGPVALHFFCVAVVRIEHVLKHLVQVLHAEFGLVHRRQHLHIANGVEAEFRGDARLQHERDSLDDLRRFVGFHEVKIAVGIRCGLRFFAAIDGVRGPHDVARTGLPVNLREA